MRFGISVSSFQQAFSGIVARDAAIYKYFEAFLLSFLYWCAVSSHAPGVEFRRVVEGWCRRQSPAHYPARVFAILLE